MVVMSMNTGPKEIWTWMPGVAAAGTAALLAWTLHSFVPSVPLLTAAVALGILVGQLPFARPMLMGVLGPGLSFTAKKFMRLGIVLLGLKLSLVDIAQLGWVSIVSVIGVLSITFAVTIWLGRLFKLPGDQPLLIATGFSICGVSAIGAMSQIVKSKDEDTAIPVALVTLFGTLAIGVLPILWHPLGFSAIQFGHWVGASVHDVGQVVATAQIAGPTALAFALIIKLTRVLALAPMVAATSLALRLRGRVSVAGGKRPPIMPLFVAGFIGAMMVRTFLPIPVALTDVADIVQTVLLAMALFALGAAVQLVPLLRTGWRALLVALMSWTLIATLAWVAVQIG